MPAREGRIPIYLHTDIRIYRYRHTNIHTNIIQTPPALSTPPRTPHTQHAAQPHNTSASHSAVNASFRANGSQLRQLRRAAGGGGGLLAELYLGAPARFGAVAQLSALHAGALEALGEVLSLLALPVQKYKC